MFEPRDAPSDDQVVLATVEDFVAWAGNRPWKRLFVVADVTAAKASGAHDRMSQLMDSAEVTWFTDFHVNPRWDDVRVGHRQFASGSCWDGIIAIGGGTAIDVAKSIRSLTGHSPDSVSDSPPAILNVPQVPLCAIPTTSGTGSEATPFAVVYVDGIKQSRDHESLLPDLVVLDSSLTRSMPCTLTAATGLDALCQSIESLWSVRSTVASRDLALRALRLSWSNLEVAVTAPSDQSREAMHQAAHLSGRAIRVSRTTAPHALSYWLTSHFGVPHGIAVALTIPAFVSFNARVDTEPVNDPRGPDHVRSVIASILCELGAESPDDVAAIWRRLLQAIDCPTCLSEVGVKDVESATRMARAVNLTRLANNPLHVDDRALLRLVLSQM